MKEGKENVQKESVFLRFKGFLEKYFPVFRKWFLRLIWVIPPVVVLIAMLALCSRNGLYPYGDKTLSWCDMDQQVVPLLMDFKDILDGKEGFFFSFKNAGGMNFYGVFFFFLSSPFSFLIVFVDKADIVLFVNILVMLKMCAIAFSASFYLEKKHPKAWLLNIALSVLYAYSGYTMMYYQNMIWLDIVYLFPLLLLGLEKLKEGKRTLFICILAACMVVNYYLGYMIVVFLLLYAFLWSVLSKDRKFAGNFLLCCAVAALLSAIVWLPSLVQYFSSGRTTSIVENLRNSGMITPYETALPTVFSILFLFPFALSVKSDGDKDIRLRFLLFLLTLVPLIIEPVAKMWQTGSYMSFPTRYAFITIFLCLTLSADCILQRTDKTETGEGAQNTSGRKRNLLAYAFSGVLLLLAVGYCVFSREYTDANVEKMDQYSHSLWGNKQSFETLFTLYAVALIVGVVGFLLHRFKMVKPLLLWVSIGVMVFSELYIAPMTYMLTPAHGVDWLRDATEIADSIDDDGFYRVKSDKEYSSHDFDANLMGSLGYNALGHYTSLTGKGYMQTIKRFGYTSYWMEVGNSGGTVLSDALLSVKYCISSKKTSTDVVQGEYYGISKTPVALPVGIVTARDIVKEQTPFTDRAALQKTLYQDAFGKENGVTVYELKDAKTERLSVTEQTDGRYLLTPDGGTGKIVFSLSLEENEALYFNVFDRNTNALKQSINEKFSISAPGRTIANFPKQKDNGLLLLGEYANKTFDVTVTVSGAISVSELGLVGIKTERLTEDAEKVRTVGLKAGKNEIAGSYHAEERECIFLSVPYDKGMNLRINGKKSELYEVYGGFTAFYLEEGENQIKITFTPQGFRLGGVLTAIGLALCTAAIVLWTVRKKQVSLPEKADTIAYYGVLAVGVTVIIVLYLLPPLLCAL